MNTIDTILKIAKVKDMDSFYKKFPSEEAFMAKYGKEFKKAMNGAKIKKAENGIDWNEVLKPAVEKPLTMEPWMTDKKYWDVGNNFNLGKLSLGSGLGAAQDLIEGIQMLKQQKEEKNRAEQWRDVTNIQLQASNLQPERLENKYLRPEDNVITGEQYFPTYGTGAGVLAKNGIYIKPSKRGTFTAAAKKRGKGTQEFASQVLANKSNYSPAMVKKANFARNASKWKKAQDGTTIDPWAMGGDVASNLLTSVMGEDGGGKIGGAIGGTAGTLIGGPIGGAIGKVGGQLIGSLIDTTDDKIENYKKQTGRNINLMMANAGAQGIHNMYSGYMEDGGLMEANDLIPLEGGIRSISYNPFIGETSQLEGPSHERGGMLVAKADNGMDISDANIVEAEGGETSTNMKDGSSVIFGDLYAPGYGKKFKNVSKGIAKKEEKQNKIIEKSAKELELLDVQTPLDKLKLKTLETNIKGATMKQQELAGEREHLIALQEAINQTADDMNIDAGALSQGKIKKAKKSNTKMAKDGEKLNRSKLPTDFARSKGLLSTPEQEFLYEYPDDDLVGTNMLPDPTGQSSYSTPEGWTKEQILALQKELNNKGNNIAVDGIWGPETEAAFNRDYTKGIVVAPEVELEELPTIEDPEMVATKDPVLDVLAVNDVQEKDNSDLWKSMLSLVPRFMPSDVEGLDPSQIAGELATLSDRPEPVWAQTIQPDLSSPYEISLQDQKNEVIAQSRAAQRMAGNNPAAQAMIAAQTSDALNKIQGEEFRFNQAMRDKIFAENRNLMNQTKLQNLEFLDRLYTRQEQAKSNTKENLRNALSSIGDKYMKNRFENKTLATYENLYNYRFDKKGRAWYMGSPASFDMEGSGGQYASDQYDPDYIPRYERDPETGRERVVGTRRRTKDEKVTARNGAIVKALKRI